MTEAIEAKEIKKVATAEGKEAIEIPSVEVITRAEIETQIANIENTITSLQFKLVELQKLMLHFTVKK